MSKGLWRVSDTVIINGPALEEPKVGGGWERAGRGKRYLRQSSSSSVLWSLTQSVRQLVLFGFQKEPQASYLWCRLDEHRMKCACIFVFKTGSHVVWLASNSPQSHGSPWTLHPPASPSHVRITDLFPHAWFLCRKLKPYDSTMEHLSFPRIVLQILY